MTENGLQNDKEKVSCEPRSDDPCPFYQTHFLTRFARFDVRKTESRFARVISTYLDRKQSKEQKITYACNDNPRPYNLHARDTIIRFARAIGNLDLWPQF